MQVTLVSTLMGGCAKDDCLYVNWADIKLNGIYDNDLFGHNGFLIMPYRHILSFSTPVMF
jgi:hypothetical protein